MEVGDVELSGRLQARPILNDDAPAFRRCEEPVAPQLLQRAVDMHRRQAGRMISKCKLWRSGMSPGIWKDIIWRLPSRRTCSAGEPFQDRAACLIHTLAAPLG